MRIFAPFSLVILGALLGPVQASPKDAAPAVPKPGLGGRAELVAALAATTHEPTGPLLSTGELGLTGTHGARPAPFLEAGEISALVVPVGRDIERCYIDGLGETGRAGKLDLTFVIGRTGEIVSLRVAAGSLPTRSARKIESCVRTAVETVRFPARRNDTTAIVPYYFQRTVAPNAGPQLSCWNPKGC